MSIDLADALVRLAFDGDLPWGDPGRFLSLDSISSLSHDLDLPGHEIEARAIEAGIYPERYVRNRQSISPEQQISLLDSTIAQVGLGGLGGNLLEILLRTGIGTIRGADGDTFEAGNLNRQALSSPANLGQTKAQAALDRASAINPSISMEVRDNFLTESTLPEFVAGADVVLDALGGLETRLHLQKAAAAASVPLVTGALAGWTGYVGVVMPGETGPADIMGHDNAAEVQLGCPSPAVTFMASLMALETVKILSNIPSSLSGKMLIVDLASLSFETISL